jgi:UDP-N-acetylglucosamine 1-carboxyvinyltransferase
LEALGAQVTLNDGYVLAREPKGGLKGARIEFPQVSVGATETALMAASLARGQTQIGNAAREPEIEDLARCLNAMGAKILGMGTSRLTVEGVGELHGADYAVMPDRIESGTYAIALALSGGELELVGARREHNGALLDLLERTGTGIRDTNRGLALYRNGARPASVDVVTAPFPGFPTDLQAQFMALMTVAEGTSVIREAIFENRFMHVPELGRLGADIRVHGDVATVRGVAKLKGAPVMATDLRASVSLVLAGLVAEGETVVNRVYHLDRGFDRLEEKLRAVGADIAREKE